MARALILSLVLAGTGFFSFANTVHAGHYCYRQGYRGYHVIATTDTGRTIPAMDDTVLHTTATTADILVLASMDQATDSRLAFRKPTREV